MKREIERAFAQWYAEEITTEELIVIAEFTINNENLRRWCVDHICEMEALAIEENYARAA